MKMGSYRACWRALAGAAALAAVFSGCGSGQGARLLDPDRPVTVVVWHYYNSQTKAAFDDLVARFNDTVGVERGIIVDAVGHGSVNQLADEVYSAANQKLGAEAMPDIFAAYPDNAYRVDQLGCLADLDENFSQEELAAYQDGFLQDSRFGEENGLKVIPIARSTEVLYLNRTDWDRFAGQKQVSLADLSTWEGIEDTARMYYEWTDAMTPEIGDGKAFLGIDSMANFILEASMQMGRPLYTFKEGQMELQFDASFARFIWDHLYVPYIRGYYGSFGAYRSDDEKTGDILAYIGSSAGAGYFPQEVTLGPNESYPIESAVLPYPRFADGEPFAIVQGAGFAVSKSDAAHEYAASIFIKWFTEKEQNVRFALASGYLPVKKDALSMDILGEAEKVNAQFANKAVQNAIETTQEMLKGYSFYANPPFEGSYDLRRLWDSSLEDRIENDLNRMRGTAGADRAQVAATLCGEEHFQQWYQDFLEKAGRLLSPSTKA